MENPSQSWETIFRFGGFELQPGERRLLKHGRLTAVSPRAFDLLVALVERAGRMMSKDELLDIVWPKRVVEEANLYVHVSALRKIVGAESIATIPGHGYRFTLELERALAVSALSPVAPTHNLPEQVTSFIGRERELAEIGKLLGSNRLLTLLGVDGGGKTCLWLQVAAEAMGGHPGGLWFLELAPPADARQVPQVVASVLGVKEEPGHPVVEALVKSVKDRPLLLILDNCEHLAPACAELARRLLRSGPQVKILATSRDHLHVTG
jgi:non-specific serine/threonine protein kinase